MTRLSSNLFTDSGVTTQDITNLGIDIKLGQLYLAESAIGKTSTSFYGLDSVVDPYTDATNTSALIGTISSGVITPLAAASINRNISNYYDARLSGNGNINNGTPISSGDLASHGAALAFDNSFSTYWQSAANQVANTTYLGFQFETLTTFNQVVLRNAGTASLCPSAVALQYSDDNSTWTTLQSYSPSTAANAVNTFTVTSPAYHIYWRLLCTTISGAFSWQAYELTFNYLSNTLSVLNNYISGGDLSGQPVSNAFDTSITTYWASSQTGTGISGAAYIGIDYIIPVTPLIVSLLCVATANFPTSILFQYSDDGSTWTTSDTITNTTANRAVVATVNSAASAHRFWRLLANANLATSVTWQVNDLNIALTNANYFGVKSTTFAANITPNNARLSLQFIYNPTIKVTNNTALSSGDYNSTYAVSNAFNGSLTGTPWSTNIFNGLTNTAYIGQDFGTDTSVTAFTFYSPASDSCAVPVVALQYSDDGVAWTTNQLSILNTAVSAITTVNGRGNPGSHRYWRLLAESESVSTTGYWECVELIFYNDIPLNTATDIASFVSRDGGSTYQAITGYSLMSLLNDGKYVYDSGVNSISGVGSGSSMVYAVAGTNPVYYLTGISFQWRP